MVFHAVFHAPSSVRDSGCGSGRGHRIWWQIKSLRAALSGEPLSVFGCDVRIAVLRRGGGED